LRKEKIRQNKKRNNKGTFSRFNGENDSIYERREDKSRIDENV
jgi:hypothetical protein